MFNLMRTKWIAEQFRLFKNLKGQALREVKLWEMAFIEEGPSKKPLWAVPSLPFRQFIGIFLFLENREIYGIGTCQNGDSWGLINSFLDKYLDPAEEWAKPDSIYRVGDSDAFPVGLISDVKIFQNEKSDISCLYLTINGHKIALQAGEVYENSDGTLCVVKDDESILYFSKPEDISTIDFDTYY